jgi:hypothetical protein
MTRWKAEARKAILYAVISGDPNAIPKYKIPARRWWEFWKPKWQWVEGNSINQFRRAHGMDELKSPLDIRAAKNDKSLEC